METIIKRVIGWSLLIMVFPIILMIGNPNDILGGLKSGLAFDVMILGLAVLFATLICLLK
jgi:hypothetical protein